MSCFKAKQCLNPRDMLDQVLAANHCRGDGANAAVEKVLHAVARVVTLLTNERAMTKAMSLYEGQGRGSELTSSKGTTFGLLNSVTEIVDHERRARSTDHRLDSAWFGPGAALKQRALDEALILIA